jgi:predicted phage baseplate assembly protein
VYRVGNGRQGNVGREKISRIVNSDSFNGNSILTIRSPMEGRGGADFEDAEDVRQFAPLAFRAQERAVTEEDYVKILQRHPQVQKASAALRWTGSWYTVFIAVDRLGGQLVDDAFKKDILKFLNKYRLAGYDLEIVDPTYVSLDISIKVCMAANYLWGDIEKGLINAFSNRNLPDGSKGFFHPDNFTFGDPVYKSRVIDTAMKVAGVTSVIVDRFQLLGKVDQHELVKGEIKMAPSEIARLDNDPNFPENGKIRFSQEGDL